MYIKMIPNPSADGFSFTTLKKSASATRNLLEKGLDLEQRLRKFSVELHEVPGCLCNTKRVPFITPISQIVSFRGSEVSHSIWWSSIFKRERY